MTQQLSAPEYDTYYALRTRTRNNGLAMMPVAGPSPQPAAVVVLHGSIEYDLISYVATKRGQPPTVPAPSTTNPNRIFLGGWQSAIFPVPDQVGVMDYHLWGYYVFGILNPEGLESDFMLGTIPFPGLDQNECIYAGQYLSYTIINQNVVPYLPGQPPEQLPRIITQISNEG